MFLFSILILAVCLQFPHNLLCESFYNDVVDKLLKFDERSAEKNEQNLQDLLEKNIKKDEILNGRVYDYDSLLSYAPALPLHQEEHETEDFVDENLYDLEDAYNKRMYPQERYNPHQSENQHKLKNEQFIPDQAEYKINHVEVNRKHPKYHSNTINTNEINQPITETKILKMPGVSPQEMDTYFCYALEMPVDDRYIVEFAPLAEMQTAHHMLLFGCDVPFKKEGYWNCREMQPVCGSGSQRIMYAWAKNAPALKMPENVGVHVGKNSGVNYLVLQVHYLHVDKFKHGATDESGVKFVLTQQRKRFLAGILLLADGWTQIPPKKKKAHIDMGCQYEAKSPKIYPFRFRTHAHKLGVVITGYRVRDDKWTLIGRGDPQRPQAFYRATPELDIKPGDKLYGRCTYNSMSKEDTTYIGATHNDEMCNFYIMYYYDSYMNQNSVQCSAIGTTHVDYPKDSDTALAVMEARTTNKSPDLFEGVHGWPSPKLDDGDLKRVGQIAGVAYDNKNLQVLIFQRGERVWGDNTFDFYNNLREKYKIPIPQKTLIWLDLVTGKIVKSAGERIFNVPHGVTIDKEGNIWVTDVGAHQVFKLAPELDKKTKNVKVLLALGERFKNGNDSKHFCKPTDVAVMKDGSFFVADGYCNSRVVKFDAKGNVLMEISQSSFEEIYSFPKPKYMSVVHSLALDEDGNRLFVADRENGRILIFHPQTGEFISHISNEFENGSVYGIAYNSANGGVLHVVNGAAGYKPVQPSGFTWSLTKNKVISKWEPEQGLNTPHDIAVSDNNRYIFVSEIRPNKIWKFKSLKYSRP